MILHGVPQNMNEVNKLVADGIAGDADTVIKAGLQNWAQELLDEGTEAVTSPPRLMGPSCTSRT
ncbi:hypothetical protein [Lacticaseibacillus sharpeae]|uniref:hypothetical protein n=1 Tax=Lacticaseibacillus sharpeae TaxID=1626 RepID=UPI0006D08DA7|nr:hypothetical protein [Lacticaseibacillus sharpeae]